SWFSSLVENPVLAEGRQGQARFLVHPDGHRLADDVILGDRPPSAAVVTVVAVVAHHEVVSLRHHPALRLEPVVGTKVTRHRRRVDVVLHAQHFLQVVDRRALLAQEAHEFLLHGLTVDVDDLLLRVVAHVVARQAHHALDVVAGVVRRDEHHDVATCRFSHIDDLGADHGQAHAVGIFVDDDEIADVERGNHRAGGNLERLEQERTDHQDGEQHGEKGLGVFHRHRFALEGGGAPQRFLLARVARFFLLAVAPYVLFAEPLLPYVGFHAVAARLGEEQGVEQPDDAGDGDQDEKKEREIDVHYLSTLSTARKASCGTSTLPTCFMRFLPAFCFS